MKYIMAIFLGVLSVFVGGNAISQTSQSFSESGNAFSNLDRPHFGVNLGVSEPEGSYDSSGELGVNFGYQLFVPIGLGASVSTVRNLPQDDRGPDIERTTVLARGTFNFGGELPVIRHSWVGLAMGPVFSDDGTDFALAPIAGFDIPIQQVESKKYISLGLDAQYLIVNNDQPDSMTVSGAVKYWF